MTAPGWVVFDVFTGKVRAWVPFRTWAVYLSRHGGDYDRPGRRT